MTAHTEILEGIYGREAAVFLTIFRKALYGTNDVVEITGRVSIPDQAEDLAFWLEELDDAED